MYKRCLCVSHISISIRHSTQTSTWWKMQQSLSLATYQLTTCINLTRWASHPIYLLQMLTTLLTPPLHSPQASVSPSFFFLLLLACLLFHQQLLVLRLPWFNEGFPPLPLLQLLLFQYCTDTLRRATMLTGPKTDPATQQFCSFQARSNPLAQRGRDGTPASAWEKGAAGIPAESCSATKLQPQSGLSLLPPSLGSFHGHCSPPGSTGNSQLEFLILPVPLSTLLAVTWAAQISVSITYIKMPWLNARF